MNKSLLITAFLWGCLSLAFPQAHSPQRNLQTLETSQGLRSSQVLCLLKDQKGNIWMGYDRMGVSRYDGRSFTHYGQSEGLSNQAVECMIQDHNGGFWFGTDGDGLFRYQENNFEHWTEKDGLGSNDIRAIVEDDEGNIWIGTGEEGVVKFDGNTFVRIEELESKKIRCISKDHKGNLWFGTLGGAIYQMDPKGQLESFSEQDGLPSNNVKSIVEDGNGNLWIGTYDAGVCVYDGNEFNKRPGCGQRITALYMDEKGEVWAGTYANGFCRVSSPSQTINENAGLSNNHITSIIGDGTGNLWLGTEGGGINLLLAKPFSYFPLDLGKGKTKIKAITEDLQGNIWLGTSNQGLLKYDGNQFTSFTESDGLSSNYISALSCDKSGTLWIGTLKGGLCAFDGNQFRHFSKEIDGLSSNSILSLWPSSQDELWIGTVGAGVAIWEGEKFYRPGPLSSMSSLTILDIFEDSKGTFWFGTEGNGIRRFDGVNMDQGPDENPLDGKTVVCIGENEEGLWFGTDGNGLYLLNESKYSHLTTHDGLSSNYISSIQMDRNQDLWVGTPKGVTYLHQAGKANSLIIHYDKTDGLKSEDNFRNSAYLDSQNRIWWGGTKGLSMLARDQLTFNLKAPTLQLNHIEINQESMPVRNDLKISHDQNHLTFHYSAIHWSAPHKIIYSFKMEGIEKQWSPPSEEIKADYRNLPPGKYTFMVKTKGEGTVWSDPFSYDFTILPPWWQSWWARILFVLAGLVLLYGLFRWRIERLKKRQKVLEQTVTRRTAEVVAERDRSEKLLCNILPAETAEELKRYGSVNAKNYQTVSVLFTDFKGFTQLSEQLGPRELVAEIDHCYKAFDQIMDDHGIEKIKTIGDAYMAAGGLPMANSSNPQDTVEAALDIRDFMLQYKKQRESEGKPAFEIRIGVHTGPVVAGIVGIKKFAYDIWGDTVNTASRMESSGEVGMVNISGDTYELVKDMFEFEYRGKVAAKGKGEMDMYFVNHGKT